MLNKLNSLNNLNNGMLAYIVQQFGGSAKGYNWKLYNGPLPTGHYGNTSSYDRTYHCISTTFDASQWRNATDLSIARTMLHEAVHAYILTYFANEPSYAALGYPDVVAAYAAAASAGVNDPNIPHHNAMGKGWVGDLAWALQQYGQSQGYNLPDQFYSDMAWGGLETSQDFLNLPSSDQNRIGNLIRVQATGQDINGNFQSQQGVNRSGCK